MIQIILTVREVEGAIALDLRSEGIDTAKPSELRSGHPFLMLLKAALKSTAATIDGSVQVEGRDPESFNAGCRIVEEQFRRRKQSKLRKKKPK